MKIVQRSGLVVASVAIFLIPAGLFLQRQQLFDWWRLRNYEPSARIAELSAHTTMTDYGQRLFYVHGPTLNDSEEFGANCPTSEHTIVLGCYITHQSIYIFDVQDKRLDGIEEVTAAHEMLHAAYDRLSVNERERVDTLLSTYVETELKNERITETIAAYAARDASVVPNETHSIIGTEVKELPAELEEYYAQYFDDRSKIVEFSEQYEEVFATQQRKLRSLSGQIETIEIDLETQRLQIEAEEIAITTESDRMQMLRSSGQIDAYNQAVPSYNASVRSYQAMVASYNQQVKTLNNLVKQYNDLAVQQRELYDAIDSRSQTL